MDSSSSSRSSSFPSISPLPSCSHQKEDPSISPLPSASGSTSDHRRQCQRHPHSKIYCEIKSPTSFSLPLCLFLRRLCHYPNLRLELQDTLHQKFFLGESMMAILQTSWVVVNMSKEGNLMEHKSLMFEDALVLGK
ncbi:uncharacterized protein LOC108999805 isoform X1 [Juglans regia]|uniref:Uncharacterized protein LOC108999805 isoform X1 n=1 Tax=Juglans regia TaxID=51240 RepID=A0A2I4FKR5_JUGRE|nr:uncharacterized protein LOC108999805 isoform X1 [Juglans regia]